MISKTNLPYYKKRWAKIAKTLHKLFPHPKIALTFGN